MVEPETVAVDGGRTRSLSQEWSRAFTLMLVLLLAVGITTVAGVRQIVGEFSGTAQRLDRESTIVASLGTSLIDHEATAHQLLSGAPVDRQAYLRQQDQISVAFRDALATFPAKDARDALSQAARSWQAALTRAGLWGDQVSALQGAHDELQAQLGADSDVARDLLLGLQKPALEAMRKGLAADAGVERLLLVALAALFGAALAVTGYFRRRVATKDLGELADAFNGMTGALHEHDLATTLRATHDSLTGLANRASLIERLAESLHAGSDRRARKESVLSIDIDDFKNVNYSVGDAGRDALLVQLAGRLKDCVRPHDLVASLGGDEFAIVVLEDDAGSAAVVIAERILEVLRAPFTVGGTDLQISASIGVAQRRPETLDAGELLRDADFAMEMAKSGGKNRYQLFDVQLHDDMVARSALKADLALAVSSHQLLL
ncbi:MAG: diguanylate cyclase/phosphodiesterase, partial [Actinobacteria bacterium]|nr:diguanylate cyclase/phosphodiesterase [Actinomycetota bacterium]